jgi:hypothetical protein
MSWGLCSRFDCPNRESEIGEYALKKWAAKEARGEQHYEAIGIISSRIAIWKRNGFDWVKYMSDIPGLVVTHTVESVLVEAYSRRAAEALLIMTRAAEHCMGARAAHVHKAIYEGGLQMKGKGGIIVKPGGKKGKGSGPKGGPVKGGKGGGKGGK